MYERTGPWVGNDDGERCGVTGILGIPIRLEIEMNNIILLLQGQTSNSNWKLLLAF